MTLLQPLIWFNLLSFWKRRVRVWGYEFEAVSFDRFLYLSLHRLGLMGREERIFLERCVRPGMHVIDVGANLGVYTLLLSRLVGESGTVTAFEPDPELFAALATNCRLNSVTNVRIYNLAAGSLPGRMVLSRSLINAGDNRLSSVEGGVTRSVSVEVRPVDEIVREEPIDFIKIDVQGWESEAFAGMKQVLTRNGSVQILFEYWPYGLTRAGCEPAKLLGDLAELGFRIYRIGSQPRAQIIDLAAWNAPTGKRFTNLHAVRGDEFR